MRGVLLQFIIVIKTLNFTKKNPIWFYRPTQNDRSEKRSSDQPNVPASGSTPNSLKLAQSDCADSAISSDASSNFSR